MTHVSRGVIARQRLQVAARGDALRELPQVVAVQQLTQFRLADQDDLQQFLRIGLEIGEQPHLLEYFGGEILRLVDNQHRAPALGVNAQQLAIEQVDQHLAVADCAGWHLDAQLLADRLQEFQRREPRIDDQRDVGIVRRARQQRADRGGLAGAHLAGELDETAGIVDAVHQVGERIGVLPPQVQVARIGRDREGFLG